MPRKIMGRRVLTGRGALSNPPGRFDLQQLAPVDDGWYMDEQPESIATTLEPESARAVITTNDSPDVPFEQSINPYRGCSHGCVYCVSGDTRVLMGDGRPRRICELKVGEELYGTRRSGSDRRYVKSRVLAHWSVIKPALRVTLEDGTTLVASGDHRFLTQRGWKFVTGAGRGPLCRPHLTTNDTLMGTGAFAEAPRQEVDYRRGYLCGMIRGDARLGALTSVRGEAGCIGALHPSRLAPCDQEALSRTRDYLSEFAVPTREFALQAAGGAGRPLRAIRAQTLGRVQDLRALIAWPAAPAREWCAGFLAGIFDAAGSFSQRVLRISNTDPELIGRIGECLRVFSFTSFLAHTRHEHRTPIDEVRLKGGLREHLRFLHTVAPASTHGLDLAGQAVRGDSRLKVVELEPLPAMRLYDITTESEDFLANGVISHNCYARPSHAYMGLSPGLDFETRIFYKQDAARILEAQLARPGYVCKPITLGANTDPYQPDERRMKVTRSILEVFARTRHPVTVITKGALVLRDRDLLADLARDGLASVAVSITTLDNDLKRAMEPRTASPQARLRAVAELNAAGVPAGVLVAPVIPALTDHELESILAASAQAGARSAGYVLLRLPYEIKDLFREWLAEHYPERAAHVMSVLREMRGGRDNDPRFGTRMRGEGPYAQLLRNRFRIACRRLNLNTSGRDVPNTTLFRPPTPPGAQMTLGL